jgi:hypothetical protein
MHREMLVAVKAGRFARLEELGRDADAAFRRGSNLFELTWQASERERGGESGSDKEMSHSRWRLAESFVFNNGQRLMSIVCRDKQDRKGRRVGGRTCFWRILYFSLKAVAQVTS